MQPALGDDVDAASHEFLELVAECDERKPRLA